MSLIPVKDRAGYYRDSDTNAIINRNKRDYNAYLASRAKMKTKDERIQTLEKKVDDLRGDIGDIISMLHSLISK